MGNSGRGDTQAGPEDHCKDFGFMPGELYSHQSILRREKAGLMFELNDWLLY